MTTPVFGIPEQVRENVNALFYEPGDVGTLAEHLATLADDHHLRARLASKSRDVLDSLPDFEAMMVQYARVLRQAAMLAVPSAVDPNPHAPRRFHPRRAKSDELGGSLAGEYFSIAGTGVGGSGIALVSETAQDLCVSGAFPGRHPAY